MDRVVEEREEFLTYPQTSPQIYSWLPYHRETPPSAPAEGGAAESGNDSPNRENGS
jgi:hypothetical protein